MPSRLAHLLADVIGYPPPYDPVARARAREIEGFNRLLKKGPVINPKKHEAAPPDLEAASRRQPDDDPFALKPTTGTSVGPAPFRKPDEEPSVSPRRSAPHWDEVRPAIEERGGPDVEPPVEWRMPIPADNSDETEEGDSSSRVALRYPSEHFLSSLAGYLKRSG